MNKFFYLSLGLGLGAPASSDAGAAAPSGAALMSANRPSSSIKRVSFASACAYPLRLKHLLLSPTNGWVTFTPLLYSADAYNKYCTHCDFTMWHTEAA